MSTHYASSTIPKAKKKKGSSGRPPAPPPRLSSLGDGEENDQGSTSGAPFLPPKPRSTKSLERVPMTVSPGSVPVHNSNKEGSESEPSLSASMTLKDVVEQHWKSLPLRIQVQEGYSGQASQLNISTADVYSLHFLKNQDAALLKDAMGTIYTVPLYSSLQVSMIYNPEEEASAKGSSKRHKEQRDTYTTTFTKVSDITAQKVLPKVVCVTKPHSLESVTLSQNELLVVRSVQKTKKKVSLKVFSVSDRAEKVIPNECKAQFSTNPQLTKLYLPDLISYVPEVFPSKVLIHLGDNFTLRSSMQQQYMYSSLLNDPVTVVGKKRERTLVASAFSDDTDMKADIANTYDLLDIPLNQDFTSDVEVAIMNIQGEELDALQETTRALMKKMLPSSLKTYQDAESDSIYNIQALLHSRYRPDNERHGMDINLPLMKRLDLSRAAAAAEKGQPPSDEEETDNEYATIDENFLSSRTPTQQNVTSPKPAVNLYQVPTTIPGGARPVSPVAPSNNYSEATHDHTLTQDSLYSTPRFLAPGKTLKQSASVSALQPSAVGSVYDVPSTRPTKGQQTEVAVLHPTGPRRQSSPATNVKVGLQREDSEEYEEMSSLVLTNKPLKVADSASNTVLQDQSASEGYAVFDPPSAQHSALRQVQKQVSMLEEKLNEIGRRVGTSVNIPELKSKLDEVSKRLTTLEQNIPKHRDNATMASATDANDTSEKNKAQLQCLTSTQVAKVLVGMGLGQYKETFERESVDGGILSALDDTTIRDELGVASKIHRMRIIKLIDGFYSCKEFLTTPAV